MLKAGVIGWPVHHSKSPIIHKFWLKQFEISGSYEAIAVPVEKIDDFFKNFKQSDLAGINITIPHKETVFQYLDEIDESATKIGAVNTIWLEDNKLKGTNTDWIGFLENLDNGINDGGTNDWDNKNEKALVIGAGGASRAILYALIKRGFTEIYLANRTLERAENLAQQFGSIIKPISLEMADLYVSEVNLIVNTTSLGMENNSSLPVILNKAQKDCVINDIVYTPLITPLLKQAKENNLRWVDGLGMLLYQAVPGFEKWFGKKPEVTPILRNLVLKDMGLL